VQHADTVDLWPICDTGKVETAVTVFDDGLGAGLL
jgi:hypothetical protein